MSAVPAARLVPVGRSVAMPSVAEWFRDRAATAALAAVGGVLVGAGLRVVTAKVSGANIGGALVLYVGPFVVVPLLALAVARATRQ